MNQHPTVLTVEQLDTALAEVVERAEAGETVIVSRGGRPVAALVAIDTLRSLQLERDLLRRLALGELESAAGEGDDLSSVLADCRLLLEES